MTLFCHCQTPSNFSFGTSFSPFSRSAQLFSWNPLQVFCETAFSPFSRSVQLLSWKPLRVYCETISRLSSTLSHYLLSSRGPALWCLSWPKVALKLSITAIERLRMWTSQTCFAFSFQCRQNHANWHPQILCEDPFCPSLMSDCGDYDFDKD